jgi:hypothetical protein
MRGLKEGVINAIMKNTVVVVADSGAFKAYRLQRTPLNTPRLELIKEFAPVSGHGRLADQVSDQAGRYHAPGGGKGSTPWGERHNIDLEQRKRLVRELATELEGVLNQPGVETCLLAASKEINHQILESLTGPARAKIEKSLPMDLTKLEPAQLLERFGVETPPVLRG